MLTWLRHTHTSIFTHLHACMQSIRPKSLTVRSQLTVLSMSPKQMCCCTFKGETVQSSDCTGHCGPARRRTLHLHCRPLKCGQELGQVLSLLGFELPPQGNKPCCSYCSGVGSRRGQGCHWQIEMKNETLSSLCLAPIVGCLVWEKRDFLSTQSEEALASRLIED